MKNSMTDMLTANCQGESFSSQVMGKWSNAPPAALMIMTGLRPIRSESLPQNGSAAMNKMLAITLAQRASPRSIFRAVAA